VDAGWVASAEVGCCRECCSEEEEVGAGTGMPRLQGRSVLPVGLGGRDMVKWMAGEARRKKSQRGMGLVGTRQSWFTPIGSARSKDTLSILRVVRCANNQRQFVLIVPRGDMAHQANQNRLIQGVF